GAGFSPDAMYSTSSARPPIGVSLTADGPDTWLPPGVRQHYGASDAGFKGCPGSGCGDCSRARASSSTPGRSWTDGTGCGAPGRAAGKNEASRRRPRKVMQWLDRQLRMRSWLAPGVPAGCATTGCATGGSHSSVTSSRLKFEVAADAGASRLNSIVCAAPSAKLLMSTVRCV